MLLETERLLLREMTEADFDALYPVLADRETMRHYPYVFDEDRVRSWIARNIRRYQTLGFGLWAVCLKEDGRLIGDCGLTMQLIRDRICPEIGYHIRRDHQRKGYASEAAAAVRDWTFRSTPFREVYSYMPADNVPSARTAIAYGCSLADTYINEDGQKTLVYVLSRDRWAQFP